MARLVTSRGGLQLCDDTNEECTCAAEEATMQFHALIAPTRMTLAALCTGGLLLSAGCRSDELQGPAHLPEATRPPVMATAPTSGLVGEWKLDETGSATVANDSKNNFDATVFGGATFVAGKIGNALNLNNGTGGTGGKYAQMPSNATLDNVQEGNYTISAWFQPASIPPDATVDNRYWAVVAKASPHLGIFYSADGKFLARHYLTGGVGEQATATVYPVGSWYHVASTVNKATGKVKIYVNGVFQDDASFTAGTAAEEYGTTPFTIGKTASFWAADGKVDQVRIYNRELSAAEIADLFNETPPAPPGGDLPAGLWGNDAADLGTLPSSGNFYKAALAVPDNSSGSHNINTLIANANQHDITLMLRLSGSPGAYTDKVSEECNNYNPTKYQAQLDRFVGNTALATALNTRRAVVLVIDEPHIKSYCKTISEAEVNQMGGWIKSRWPGAITAVRSSANLMKFGWITTRTTPFSPTFWSKIDYAWGTWNHSTALSSTPEETYQSEKAGLAEVNLGMIPGINIWNGGTKACWTQPNGTLGRIWGSQAPSSVRGTVQTCSQVNEPSENTDQWVASPALLRQTIDAAVTDPDAPMFLGWTHVGPDDTGNSWSNMSQYESRSDFVSALKYWNTTGASRTNGTGWRPAK
jgi:hypothetical protein